MVSSIESPSEKKEEEKKEERMLCIIRPIIGGSVVWSLVFCGVVWCGGGG